MYRPPRDPFSEADGDNTARICHMLRSLQGKSIIIGDFNFPGIDWDLLYTDNPGEKVFLQVLQDKFLTQHVDFPTHDCGNTLDLVLSSTADMVYSVQDCSNLGKSDHRLVRINFNGLSIESQSTEMVPDWSKADFVAMREAISSTDWDGVLSCMSGVEAWDKFKIIVESQIELCIPKKLRRKSNRPLWLSKKHLEVDTQKEAIMEVVHWRVG